MTVESLTHFREGLPSASGRLGGGKLGRLVVWAARIGLGVWFAGVALSVLTGGLAAASLIARYPLYGEFPGQAVDYLIGTSAIVAGISFVAILLFVAAFLFKGVIPNLKARSLALLFLGVMVVGGMVSVGASLGSLPEIRTRLNAATANVVRPVPAFTDLRIDADGNFSYMVTSDLPRVEIPVRLDGNQVKIDVEVVNGTLRMSGTNADKDHRDFYSLGSDGPVIIYGPAVKSISVRSGSVMVAGSFMTSDLAITVENGGTVYYSGTDLASVILTAKTQGSIFADSVVLDRAVFTVFDGSSISLGRVKSLEATVPLECQYPIVTVVRHEAGGRATVNGKVMGIDGGSMVSTCVELQEREASSE